jgi:hypothetical protein
MALHAFALTFALSTNAFAQTHVGRSRRVHKSMPNYRVGLHARHGIPRRLTNQLRKSEARLAVEAGWNLALDRGRRGIMEYDYAKFEPSFGAALGPGFKW